MLDSKEPDWSKFREFLMKEVRYTSLMKTFPAEAEELFEAAEENAKWRYNSLPASCQDGVLICMTADAKGRGIVPRLFLLAGRIASGVVSLAWIG